MVQSQCIQQVKLELDDEEGMQQSRLQRRSQPVDQLDMMQEHHSTSSVPTKQHINALGGSGSQRRMCQSFRKST
jgi:hypothetical protein